MKNAITAVAIGLVYCAGCPPTVGTGSTGTGGSTSSSASATGAGGSAADAGPDAARCPEVPPCSIAIGCFVALDPCDPTASPSQCATGLTCAACPPPSPDASPYAVPCEAGCFACQ